MEAAWIGVIGGLAGVLLGSGISELLRRSNRIEIYASHIFDKRTQIYEQLYTKMVEGQDVVEQVMKNDELSAEERHAMISTIVLDLADFCDVHQLYLNEELALHCSASFMGAEEVIDIKSLKKREEAAKAIRINVKNAKSMIKAESGIARIDRFFGSLTRAKHSSPVIDHYRSLQNEKNS